ncbi:MAG: AraC family transcriptional regulator [Polyangiales bacterium]
MQSTREFGPVTPGVDFVRLRATSKLFRGMKAHYGTSLTLAGRARVRVDGADYAQAPGTLGLKQPGQVHHDLERDAPGSFQLISFDAALVDASRAALDHAPPDRFVDAQVDPSDRRARPLRQLHDLVLADTTDRFALDVAVTAAVAAFTSFFGPRTTPARMRPTVRRARQFLLEHLAEKVTLDALAEHARTDKFHLCREFSRELGLPPYAFLTQARIVRASIMLRRGMAASDVASRVGFCDQSQMHRHFVRIVGCTPGTYAGERARKHFVLP